MTWSAAVLTLFPEMFPGPLGHSLAGRALDAGVWRLKTVDIRAFARDKHASVDDTPFGGGAGMVMRADVVSDAIHAAWDRRGPLIHLSPRGRPLTQRRVAALAAGAGPTLLCGRYEGIDQRLLDAWAPEEVSLGDFVLSGGEPAALALLDACVRLLPGVAGKAESVREESFESGVAGIPALHAPGGLGRGARRRKSCFRATTATSAPWRQARAEDITRTRRPDLWARRAENEDRRR